MSQGKHVLMDGKIMREKALSFCEHRCEGIEERKEIKARKGWLASLVKCYSLKNLKMVVVGVPAVVQVK